ncbi:MAG TPA: hypothetical protein VKZ68_07705 [Ohtaekwangia sp.]|nr:hypothetical protein [Ohtaekwangia sp.]
MLGFYTPVLILQALCLYHAYQKRAEQRWYWFILLFPVVGCIIYIFHHFGNRSNLERVAEGVKVVVNSNYKIQQLEKQLRHSDTAACRIQLADAYVDISRIDEAIALYQQTLTGFMADDPVVRMKLLRAYYLKGDFDSAISYGKLLADDKAFQQSEERIAFAWSLFHAGQTEEAERVFASMDRTFTNYIHRLEFCRFLEKTGRTTDLDLKLRELFDEFDTMKGNERRMYKDVFAQLRELSYRKAKT